MHLQKISCHFCISIHLYQNECFNDFNLSIIAFTTNINIISSLFHIYQEEDFKDLLIEDQVRTHLRFQASTRNIGVLSARILLFLSLVF